MKPSVLAASLGKRLVLRASRMRRAGVEPKFSRDFRAIAQLTEPKFRVSHIFTYTHTQLSRVLIRKRYVIMPATSDASSSVI